MDKVEVFKKLNENLINLNKVENKISILKLAIYQKEIELAKEKILNELKKYFDNQLKIYYQKEIKFQGIVKENIKILNNQIDSLIELYDELYLNVFKIMQNASNNQKKEIANIIILEEQKNNKDITNKKIEEIKRKKIAYVQKKINYSVIIEECSARINWCIENSKLDINKISNYILFEKQLCKKTLWNKITNKIANKIFGKNKYKNILKNYENETLKKVKEKLKLQMLEVMFTIKGVKKQMKLTKKQIVYEYNETIKN